MTDPHGDLRTVSLHGMQPWHGLGEANEAVIDLGAVTGAGEEPPAPPPPPPPPPERPASRWLLVCATVLVTLLASVAGTLLYQRITAPEPPTAAMPADAAELRAWLAAEGPPGADAGAVPVHFLETEAQPDPSVNTFPVAPGTYRVHLRCGMLGTAQLKRNLYLNVTVQTTVGVWTVSMACPSQVVAMTAAITFPELGGIRFDAYLAEPEGGPPHLLAAWLVPEGT